MSDKIEDLNNWEVMQAQKVAGYSILAMEEEGLKDPRAIDLIIAIAWQFARRSNPNLTFQQYAMSTKLEESFKAVGLESVEEDVEEEV